MFLCFIRKNFIFNFRPAWYFLNECESVEWSKVEKKNNRKEKCTQKSFRGLITIGFRLKKKGVWSIPGTAIGLQAWRLVTDSKNTFHSCNETRVAFDNAFSESNSITALWIYRKVSFWWRNISDHQWLHFLLKNLLIFPCFWHMTLNYRFKQFLEQLVLRLKPFIGSGDTLLDDPPLNKSLKVQKQRAKHFWFSYYVTNTQKLLKFKRKIPDFLFQLMASRLQWPPFTHPRLGKLSVQNYLN